MKKVLLLLLCIMVLLSSILVMPASAASSLTVDCGSTLRAVTHCASGSLYGLTETKPADIANLVAPLKPAVFTNPARAGSGFQQPIGAAIPSAGRITGTTGKVMIRLADIFPGWPYRFTNMTDWQNKVKSVISDKKASGYGNFYGYEIWNEPDGTWNNSNGTFNELWRQTYNTIRSNDSGAKIIGPSYSYYNQNSMNSFLSFCKANNCLPDIICWHELSGIQNVSNNIKTYRALESSLGISARPISINEYCDADHNLEGQPGSSARFIGKFERYKVDSACITWWFTAYPGRLGSLLANDTQKGAGWYLYKWYADMTGNMVSVTPPNDASNLVDGAACVDSEARYISYIFGGNNDGAISTTFKNIPSFIGSTATVKIEKVDWKSKDTVCNGTTAVSTSNYNVVNGQLTVNLTGTNNSSGYRIYITPGSGAEPRNAFSKLEGESYDNQSGIQNGSCSEGGECIGYIENGDYAVYSNVDFSNGAKSFKARAASATSGGNIEVRLDSATGTLVGTCTVPGTGDWQNWTDVACNVSGVSGKHDLYLKFTGTSGYLFNINWFTFSTASISVNSGDINSDGTVDALDLVAAKKHLLGVETLENPALADLDASGEVDALDYSLLKQYLLGLNIPIAE